MLLLLNCFNGYNIDAIETWTGLDERLKEMAKEQKNNKKKENYCAKIDVQLDRFVDDDGGGLNSNDWFSLSGDKSNFIWIFFVVQEKETT